MNKKKKAEQQETKSEAQSEEEEGEWWIIWGRFTALGTEKISKAQDRKGWKNAWNNEKDGQISWSSKPTRWSGVKNDVMWTWKMYKRQNIEDGTKTKAACVIQIPPRY